MFLKKSDIYYSKWATVVQKFQLSMTKLGNHDETRWFDGIWLGEIHILRYISVFYQEKKPLISLILISVLQDLSVLFQIRILLCWIFDIVGLGYPVKLLLQLGVEKCSYYCTTLRYLILNRGYVPVIDSTLNSYRWKQCYGSGIRCLFDPWIRDPGWVKSQDPDPGWTTRIIFPRA